MSLHHSYQLREMPVSALPSYRLEFLDGALEPASAKEIEELMESFMLLRYRKMKSKAQYVLVRKVVVEAQPTVFQEFVFKERLKKLGKWGSENEY